MSQPALDLGFEDDPADPTFTVRELAGAINALFQRGFDDGVWVRGEIQGWQERANGHAYFNLTEESDEGKATVSVVLFGGTFRRLLPLLRRHRLHLENGIAVRIHGRLEFYGPTGRTTLVMDGLDARFTLGQLAAQRDQLLRVLVGEGLLDRNRRLPLPVVPLRVGLVTSVDSAAWHDVRSELARSGLAFRLRVVDVRVQGEGAEQAIAEAIAQLSTDALDVIMLVRGGGARTELATFDSEPIARAIAWSAVPVFTGLGHEIDRSVADEVAHTALKTPTACAAALVARVSGYLGMVEGCWEAIARRASHAGTRAEGRLLETARRVARCTAGAVDTAGQRLDLEGRRLRREVDIVAIAATARLDRASGRLVAAARRAPLEAERSLAASAARAGAFDPARALARGWSITHTADGRLVRSVADTGAGVELVTTVADGQVRSRVEGARR